MVKKKFHSVITKERMIAQASAVDICKTVSIYQTWQQCHTHKHTNKGYDGMQNNLHKIKPPEIAAWIEKGF